MLNKLRSLSYKYAVISSVVIALVFYLVYDAVGRLFSIMPESLVRDFSYQILAMIYPLGFVLLFGFASSFKSEKFLKGLGAGLFLLICELLILFSQLINSSLDENTVWKPWYLIVYGIVRVVGIAVREEAVFRATIQNILAKKYANSIKGIWFTAIVSAVIFGLIHAFNIFVGVDVGASLIQAVVNIGVGLLFAAIYLRSANIWVMILLHTVTDAAGLFTSLFCSSTVTEVMNGISWQSFAIGAIMVAVAAFLLRPSKCREILARGAQ